MAYFIEVFIAFSQLLNTFCNGKRNQTLSARTYVEAVLNKKKYWFVTYHLINSFAYMIGWFHFLLTKRAIPWENTPDMIDHCKTSYEYQNKKF